jgi:hypothetical protein
MISFLFSIVAELKTFRNAYKLPRLIEQLDVISHEQSHFMENLCHRQQRNMLWSSCRVPNIFVQF